MNRTKIFPYDFLKDKENGHFYIRLLPNLTSIETTGEYIVKSLSMPLNKAFHIPDYHYYSYAVINNWDDMNRYVKKEVSIIRYGKTIHDFIIEIIEGDRRNIFDLQSPYCIKLKVRYPNFENYYFETNENIIYDKYHPGKNNEEEIKKFLLNRDISLEQLAINCSDEPHKSLLKKKYADIIRDEKLKLIGV